MDSSDMTADQAMTRPVAMGRAVIAALGTTPWTLTIGPDAEACTLGDGSTGMNVTWSARGPASSTPGEDADVAAGALRKQGLSVTIQHVSGGGARVVGRNDSFGVVEFDAQATSTSVIATTACVKGDAEHYRDVEPQEPIPTRTPG